MDKVREVIIGVGALVFDMHAPALALETTRLAGVCEIRTDAGQRRADALGVPFFAGYQQMIAELKPDAAIILTPHYNHAEIAIDCLKAGCHVLVEKPMALEVAEADAMVETARQANRLLAVNFQHRFRPEVRAARRIIQQGELGKLQRIKLITPWPRSQRYYSLAPWRATWRGEGGGVLMNQAPHDLDLVCHLMGSPKRVYAWTRTNLHRIEVEDTATALLEWEEGATGYLHVSTAESGLREEIEIVGTGGILRIGVGSLSFDRYQVDARQYLLETDELWHGPPAHPVDVQLPEGEGDHVAVRRDFHAAILNGAVPTRETGAYGDEGLMSLELANAILYSSHTRAEVEIPLDRRRYSALLAGLKGKKDSSRAAEMRGTRSAAT